MEPATDGKSLEKRLKVAALAWACTLTPPTGFEHPEPPSANGSCRSLLFKAISSHLRRFLTRNTVLILFFSFPR